VLSVAIRTGKENEAGLYFLRQHYGRPTRMLDWSTIPLAAIYFSVSNPAHDDFDGELYMMDAYQLAEDQDEAKNEKFKDIATSRDPHFRNFMGVLTDWKKPEDFPEFILPDRLDRFDPRVILRRGGFTFRPSACPILTQEAEPHPADVPNR